MGRFPAPPEYSPVPAVIVAEPVTGPEAERVASGKEIFPLTVPPENVIWYGMTIGSLVSE
jgi:hypothetical protein